MPQDETVFGRPPVSYGDARARMRHATSEAAWARILIAGTAMLFLGVFLIIPLVAVFAEALRQGVRVYIAAITNAEARSAIRLTLLTASLAVPLNVLFGLASSCASARF